MSFVEVITKLILSIIIGGMIGYEREFKHKTAGFRTHILVCIGATVTSMIQLLSLQESAYLIQQNSNLAGVINADIGRLGAQVITGVGFLGAGAIIHDKGSIKGLTTAASLWVVACIGLAVGLGYYHLSILAALSVFITLGLLKRFEKKRFVKSSEIQIQIDFLDMREIIKDVTYYFNDKNIKITNIEVETKVGIDNTTFNSVVYTLKVPSQISINDIKEELHKSRNIIKINVL